MKSTPLKLTPVTNNLCEGRRCPGQAVVLPRKSHRKPNVAVRLRGKFEHQRRDREDAHAKTSSKLAFKLDSYESSLD
jgi:hypothetical protein